MTALFWTPEAIQDRESIFEHIEQDDPQAAIALDALFEAQTVHLMNHPQLGRPGRVLGTREWVVHPSYVLIYSVLGSAVRILRVLHTARQWP